MNKEEMLFSNCSEATFRINTNDLSESKVKELKKKLLKLMLETQNEDIKISPNISLEDLEDKFVEDSYETSISEGTTFGTKTLTVDGDFPYNHGEVLEAFAEKNDLTFEFEDDN